MSCIRCPVTIVGSHRQIFRSAMDLGKTIGEDIWMSWPFWNTISDALVIPPRVNLKVVERQWDFFKGGDQCFFKVQSALRVTIIVDTLFVQWPIWFTMTSFTRSSIVRLELVASLGPTLAFLHWHRKVSIRQLGNGHNWTVQTAWNLLNRILRLAPVDSSTEP